MSSFRLLAITSYFFVGFFGIQPVVQANIEKSLNPYVTVYWGVADGLPHSRLHAVLQDQLGFIWAATQNGLVRFDGQSFTIFNSNNTELPTSIVTALFLDSKNRLWIGTYKGVAVAEKGKITRLLYSEKSNWQVNAFYELPEGEVLIATDQNVLIYDQENIAPISELNFPAYSFVSFDNRVFIGSQGKIVTLRDKVVASIELPDANEDLKVNTLLVRNESLLIGTDSGIFNYQNDSIQQYSSPFLGDEIKQFYFDQDKRLWIAAQSGLYYESSNGDFKRLRKIFGINQLFQDRENTLWLASNDLGLISMWPGWVERYSVESGLANPNTWSIAENKPGSYWVGTSEGLYLLENGQYEKLAIGINNLVYSLKKIDGNRLLVGGRQGLLEVDTITHKIHRYFEELDGVQVNGFYRDNNNTLWVLTAKGVYVYQNATLSPYKNTELQNRDVRSVFHRKGKELWFGTKSGLQIFAQQKSEMVVPSQLKDSFITSISEDSVGRLWISTYSKGLFVFDNQWQQIGSEQGLLSDSVFNVVEAEGYIWLSSFRGLYRLALSEVEAYFSGSKESIKSEAILSEERDFYGAERGHCCHGVGGSKVFIGKDELWYVTNDGLVKINTIDIKPNNIPPISSVVSIATANESFETIYNNRAVLLAGRDVRIKLASLSYKDPKSNQFQVKLSGVDSTWKNLFGKNKVFYTNLSPGNYVFSLRSSNNSGVYSDKISSIHFEVQGSFTESLWFKLLLLLFASLLFYLIYGLLRARSLDSVLKIQDNFDAIEIENSKLKGKITKLENYIDHYVYEDPLTGAFTLKFLEHQLNMDIPYYERILPLEAKQQLSIVFVLIDIDDFKNVNIKYSRNIGDLILQQITNLIKRTIRDSDYVIRVKNDKFIVVFRPVLEENIATVTERIRKLVEKCKFEINQDEYLRITSSISYADYPIFPEVAHKLPWRSLLDLAEQGLVEAKQAGGNRWIGYQLKESVVDKAKASNSPIDIGEIHQDNFELHKSWTSQAH